MQQARPVAAWSDAAMGGGSDCQHKQPFSVTHCLRLLQGKGDRSQREPPKGPTHCKKQPAQVVDSMLAQAKSAGWLQAAAGW